MKAIVSVLFQMIWRPIVGGARDPEFADFMSFGSLAPPNIDRQII